jgi:lysophospholipase L1-like esterase
LTDDTRSRDALKGTATSDDRQPRNLSMAKPRSLPPVVLLVVSLVVAAGLVEIMSRAFDSGMNFDVEMWKYARGVKRVSSSSEIAHEHTPGTSGTFMGVPVSINSMGLRDREYPLHKPVGTVRVLMLGDSLTFGWGVKVEDTPSKLLEALLNLNGGDKKYEVINAGVGNYNTLMEVAYFLERGRLLEPEIVVLNYFINDAEPTPRRRINSFVEFSQAAVLISGAIDTLARNYFGRKDWRAYYQSLYDPRSRNWAETQAAMENLIAYCEKSGIRIMIVSYPELHQLSDYPFSSITEAVGKIAAEEDVPFVDLLSSVQGIEPRSLWVSPTDAHPNARANTKYADRLHWALAASFSDLFIEPYSAATSEARQ